MKLLNFLVSLIMMPSLSWGGVCASVPTLGKQWQSQEQWKNVQWTPSTTNPQLKVSGFVDENQNSYVSPLDVSGVYNAQLDIRIQSVYAPKKFVEYCSQSETYGSVLSTAREDASNTNQFRIKLDYLPTFGSSAKNPYVTQNFQTDANGIGVRVLLQSGSLTKKSESFFATEEISETLSRKISQDLQRQIQAGSVGSVVVSLDQMDDLACDLLKGQAQIEFFHSGSMDDAKVKAIESVSVEELWNLYDRLRGSLHPAQKKDERLFAAGVAWMRNEMESPLSSAKAAQNGFNIVSQMVDFSAPLVMKKVSPEEMQCLAISESQFKKSAYNANVSLAIQTQNLQKLMAEQ